jgi:hypothetical protein
MNFSPSKEEKDLILDARENVIAYLQEFDDRIEWVELDPKHL